jgi:hypothetical protein
MKASPNNLIYLLPKFHIFMKPPTIYTDLFLFFYVYGKKLIDNLKLFSFLSSQTNPRRLLPVYHVTPRPTCQQPTTLSRALRPTCQAASAPQSRCACLPCSGRCPAVGIPVPAPLRQHLASLIGWPLPPPGHKPFEVGTTSPRSGPRRLHVARARLVAPPRCPASPPGSAPRTKPAVHIGVCFKPAATLAQPASPAWRSQSPLAAMAVTSAHACTGRQGGVQPCRAPAIPTDR